MKLPWKKAYSANDYYVYPACAQQGEFGDLFAKPGDQYLAIAIDPDDPSKGYLPWRNGKMLFNGEDLLCVGSLDALDEQFFHLPSAFGEWREYTHRDGQYWRK